MLTLPGRGVNAASRALAARVDRIESFTRRADGLWLAAIASLVYLVPTLVLASTRPLWYDELFSLHLARIDDGSELWRALLTGGDQQPPPFYRITHLSLAVFGEGPLALRLPAIVGFWVMGLALFRVVARVTSPLYGCLAMTLPWVTLAYDYAHEGRPYGLVLGFSGLALAGWVAATRGRPTAGSLGMAVGLAGAVSSHYYAALVCVALAAGEAVRSLRERRVEPRIWLAFAAPGAALLAFSPLMVASARYSEHFWRAPFWSDSLAYYGWLLGPSLLAAVVALVLLTLTPASDSPPRDDRRTAAEPHLAVAGLALVGLPLLAVGLAELVTKAYHPRYVLAPVLGVGVLAALGVHRLARGRPRPALLLLAAIAAGFLWNARLARLAAVREAREVEDLISALRSLTAEGLPVVLTDGKEFVQAAFYWPQDEPRSFEYLADPASEVRYLGHDTIDRGMVALEPWLGLSPAEYAPFLRRHERFLVYGAHTDWTWLLGRLAADGVECRLIGSDGERLLFRVGPRHAEAAAGRDPGAP